MSVRLHELKELLKARGIRPSSIRLRVLQYLLEARSHPTAEEIYRTLVREFPALSRASVYNALAALCAAGVVRMLTIERDEARYDVVENEHGHFQCDGCGKVYDFIFSPESLRYGGLEGFVVREKHLYFRGICPQCQKGGVRHGESGKDATAWGAVSGDGGEDHPRSEETPR